MLFLLALCPDSHEVQALPLERFHSGLAFKCDEGQRECLGVLRVDDALGRHTGIAVVKSEKGEVSVHVGREKGLLQLKAHDVTDLTLSLSWDGDSNPNVLSGSGLNCLDLTKGGAHAFVVAKMSADPECDEAAIASTCPQFTVESRVYDAQDPTGQRFSSSVISRGISTDSDLFIPFSNFTRRGPRGKGSFSCVGAVTVAFKFLGLRELNLAFGEIFTNADEANVESVSKVSGEIILPVPEDLNVVDRRDIPKMRAGSDKNESVSADATSPIKKSNPKVSTTPSSTQQPVAPNKLNKRVLEEAVFGSLVAE